VWLILVTEDVFHLLMSLLNAAALLTVLPMSVTEDVIHLLMSPLNVAALGLPLLDFKPASVRFV
jgi:hypothetical protein